MMERRAHVDALRGLMLVLMTITHVPTHYSTWLSQPFGFVSSAEGFVFLSAYMVGAVYTVRAVEKGVGVMWATLLRRARLVWLCQVGMLVFLFTLIAQIALHTDRHAIKNLLSFYLSAPADAFWSSLFMLYNPPLLDILPMYFMFMLASPLALTIGLRRNGWLLVITISVTLWLLSQIGVPQAIYGAIVRTTNWKVPLEQTGAFHIVAWQLVWILGMWMGARQAMTSRRACFPGWLVALALLYAIGCLVWRHAIGQSPFGMHADLNLLFDKWRLGPLRVIDFFALLVVVMRFGPRLAVRLPLGLLETLGRASLLVFCAHIAAVLVVLSLIGDAAGKAPLWAETALLVSVLLCLYGIALISNSIARRKPVQSQIPGDLTAETAV